MVRENWLWEKNNNKILVLTNALGMVVMMNRSNILLYTLTTFLQIVIKK